MFPTPEYVTHSSKWFPLFIYLAETQSISSGKWDFSSPGFMKLYSLLWEEVHRNET